MKKFYLKLLTASVLLSAVTLNINLSYSMEDKNEIQIGNKNGIQEELNKNESIIEITSKVFCNHLLKDNYLLNMLQSYNIGELKFIEGFTQTKIIQKKLIKLLQDDEKLYNDASNMRNLIMNNIYNSDSKYYIYFEYRFCVNRIICCIDYSKLRKQLNMDMFFDDICDNYFKETDKSKKEIYINKFLKYLFQEGNCDTLNSLFEIYIHLYLVGEIDAINKMLQDSNVQEHLISLLKINNGLENNLKIFLEKLDGIERGQQLYRTMNDILLMKNDQFSFYEKNTIYL